MMLAGALCLVLAGIAALHAYWGLGGRWPGHDEAGLADRVIGKTAFVRLNTRYYSPLCLLLGAGLIANLAGR